MKNRLIVQIHGDDTISLYNPIVILHETEEEADKVAKRIHRQLFDKNEEFIKIGELSIRRNAIVALSTVLREEK